MSKESNANQRIMLTKRLIHEALLKLLTTQPITKISIRELCQIAGINRSTFYNHYGSQYDVLNEIAHNYLEETSYTILNALQNGDKINVCLVKILKYIKQNITFLKLILVQENYDLLSHLEVSLPSFQDIICERLPNDLSQDQKEAIATSVQYGSLRLLKEWVLSDCARSPKDEAALILFVAGRIG